MILLAISPENWANTQILGAGGLAAIGCYQLLPRPGRRSVALGTFLCLAAAAIAGMFLLGAFGNASTDLVSRILFWLFSAGAVGFGVVLVTQSNPARGAMAFAFVILSSCGLFLLLAAPFLMAATVIIYAGAVIVTFLFLLMLSHTGGVTDENDRTREPLLGSLAGFAFTGLIFFTLFHQSSMRVLPTPPLTVQDRAELAQVQADLEAALAVDMNESLSAGAFEKADEEFREHTRKANERLSSVLERSSRAIREEGSPVPVQDRIRPSLRGVPDPQGAVRYVSPDPRVQQFVERTEKLVNKNTVTGDLTLLGVVVEDRKKQMEAVKARREAVKSLRDDVVVYTGNGLLPARNVANIGYLVYSEYLLAVEMAGTLLLVATIGAVAIAGRKGVAA